MRCLLMMGMAVVVVSTLASAQDTARFRSRVGAGTISGSEQFTIVDTASGHEVTGKIAMKRGGADMNFTLRQLLTADWATEKYSLEMTGALGGATVTAERKGEALAFAVKTPAGTPSQDIPLEPRLVLMDTLLAAPYQVLLNMTVGKPGAVTVVVPFRLVTISGTLEAAGTSPGTLDGRPVVANKVLFKIASAAAEIFFDPSKNRLLRVYMPAQDAELVREGFAVAPGSEPKPADRPAGVSERDVTFKTIDGAPYPAVLCLPKAFSSAPLVVMMQGSGPQDRDETIGPNKPFRDLAWGLAERGIATLRYDKRTYAFPKSYKGSLDSESIDDGVDAVKYAQTIPDVDRTRVYVLGHSLGGLAAIYTAGRVPLTGLILMATGGRPMDRVIRDQVKTLNAVLGAAKVEEVLKVQDRIMAKVRAGTATAEELQGQPPEGMRDMITRDPIAELQKTKQPLLVLKGGKDAQVFQADFDALQAVASGRPGSEAKLFPSLTHIFTVTDGPAEFRAILQPGHVAPEVIDTIAKWVKKTGAGR
jgi:dienelactone hydrolase